MTAAQRIRLFGKPVVFAACLVPLAKIVADIFLGGLSANPIEDITHRTGDWTLILLLVTLSVTPLRAITGWGVVVRFRRMLGLFAYFYGVLHFSVLIVFDHLFDIAAILEDIIQRPYITVGFTSLVLLTPLAITSTNGWVKRLGGRRWNKLHRLIYVSAAGGVLHYLWLVKADVRRPTIFAVLLILLLATRLRRRRSGRRSKQPVRSAAADSAVSQKVGSVTAG